MQLKNNLSAKAGFFLAFGLASGLFCWISWWNDFHVSYNDFWGILFYARHLSWEEKASLYNGFYPIGYALLLRLLPFGLVIQGMTLINVILAGLMSAATTQLVRKTGSNWIPGLIFGLVIFYPLVMEYAISVPPEIGCAAFTALALFLLWDQAEAMPAQTGQGWRFALAGGLLGLATLWRNHTIASSGAIILAYLLIIRELSWKGKASLVAGFLGIFSIQVAANLLSGHGALETAQKFNLYKLLNVVDWRNMPTPAEVAAFSVVEAFWSNPGQVASLYLSALSRVLIYALPAALGIILFPGSRHIRFQLFSALGIGLYALVVALGGSGRAPLVTLSLFFVSLGFLMADIEKKISEKFSAGVLFRVGVGLLTLPVLFYCLATDFDLIIFNRAQHDNMTGLTSILLKAGMQAPDEVFTDSFAVYFPDFPPYSPRMVGGWNVYYLWGYPETYPELPFASAAAFEEACREQGVKYLILSPKSDQLSDFLNTLYLEGKNASLPSFELIRKLGNFKVFKRVVVSP
jgi:hypothetical protein